jgi:hypothetical protein
VFVCDFNASTAFRAFTIKVKSGKAVEKEAYYYSDGRRYLHSDASAIEVAEWVRIAGRYAKSVVHSKNTYFESLLLGCVYKEHAETSKKKFSVQDFSRAMPKTAPRICEYSARAQGNADG